MAGEVGGSVVWCSLRVWAANKQTRAGLLRVLASGRRGGRQNALPHVRGVARVDGGLRGRRCAVDVGVHSPTPSPTPAPAPSPTPDPTPSPTSVQHAGGALCAKYATCIVQHINVQHKTCTGATVPVLCMACRVFYMCDVQRAAYVMHYTTCDMQRAARNVQQELLNVQPATCSIQRATDIPQGATHSTHHAT
jgi:hypothetical protein